MADIPVNRVANNLVITQKDNSKYLGLWIPTIGSDQINNLPVTIYNENKGRIAPILVGGVPSESGSVNYIGLNLNLSAGIDDLVWEQFVTCSTAASGAGLVSGSAFVMPKGPRAQVEVASNQIDGFKYYDTTNHAERTFYNGAWHTIATA